MTKITLTSQEESEIVNIRNTAGTFRLPINTDLEIIGTDGTRGTIYGVTDSDIEGSMANVGYVKDYVANNAPPPVEIDSDIVIESIDVDFGGVNITTTSNTFTSFNFTATDYDLGGIRSPRPGYNFGMI